MPRPSPRSKNARDHSRDRDRRGKSAGGGRAAPLRIIFEDRDLMVIFKPHGLLTSTTPRERRATLLAQVQRYLERHEPRSRLGLIHRLDRAAAGLLVFSKNNDAYESLKRQFFHHTVERVYLALCDGKATPPHGTIESFLIERADGTVYSARRGQRGGERAVTHYETIHADKNQSLMRVTLHTGKKHQIRVHLSERGIPIINDPMYHPKPGAGPLHLVAVRLSFDHPRTGAPCSFEVEPPPELRKRADKAS